MPIFLRISLFLLSDENHSRWVGGGGVLKHLRGERCVKTRKGEHKLPPDWLHMWHTGAVWAAFIYTAESKGGETNRDRGRERRELKGKDRDGEMDEVTVTGDWVTKPFACSLTAGSSSPSSPQLRLLLREEQIMTRGQSTRFRVQTLQEGWRRISGPERTQQDRLSDPAAWVALTLLTAASKCLLSISVNNNDYC